MAYLVTFRSLRPALPPAARQLVVDTIRFDEGRRFYLGCAVVMPDHVHMIIEPMKKDEEYWFDLAEIMKPIKGVSARRINRLLGTIGSVWMDESFDRIIRNREELGAFWGYVTFNPVKAELSQTPEEYPFFIKGTQESLDQVLRD